MIEQTHTNKLSKEKVVRNEPKSGAGDGDADGEAEGNVDGDGAGGKEM